MATRLYLGFCLIIALANIECNVVSRLRRIEDRLDGLHDRLGGLQDRFDRESRYRREDLGNLLEKIGSNSAGLNYSAIDVHCREPMETSDMSADWRRDLMQLTMAFKDEKLLNTKIRDQFPNVANQVEIGMRKVFNEINTNQMKLDNIVNEINTNQMKLDGIVHEMDELKNELVEIREASISKTDGSISNNVRPKSCLDIYERGNNVSGQYDVYPDGVPNPIRVFCDQDTDGGGWTVFQRRKDGSVDFYREWLDYKNGFGDLDGEFWLGNEYLSILTSNSSRQLRIEMENFDGEKRYAAYAEFQIRPEDEKYMLKVAGYSGNAGDSLEYHNGKPFTTKDRDNDPDSTRNCAVQYTGAWWYDAGYYSNLNGMYLGRKDDWKGIVWYHWDKNDNSLKFTEMKFK